MDRFNLQEVVTSLKLGSGEARSSAAADPMSGNLPDAVGMSCRRVATVSPCAFTDSVAVAAVAWRVWICDSRTDETKESEEEFKKKGTMRKIK